MAAMALPGVARMDVAEFDAVMSTELVRKGGRGLWTCADAHLGVREMFEGGAWCQQCMMGRGMV